MTDLIYGPTFEEMLYPERVAPDLRKRAALAVEQKSLDPVNLFNITWKDPAGGVRYLLVPPELSGVRAPILVLLGKYFPTGSHKVGAAYSVMVEKQIQGEITPGQDTLIFPSTGNYGIGGAWVGTSMGYQSVVLLPANMSRERFELITAYGATYIKTPGCESNVKEIYDKCTELEAVSSHNKILNQFEVMGNYRFHWHVTGNSALAAVTELAKGGLTGARPAAFVSAMGSGGTIAAGDRLKQAAAACKIVGLEPMQCPTLFNNGYGNHDIQGIGDRHVTWIHNVNNMDALMCVDDLSCKRGLQVLADPVGMSYLGKELGISPAILAQLIGSFGISGICNLLGAIKTAKYYDFGERDVVITVATDAIDRYHSVLNELTSVAGQLTEHEAHARVATIFHGAGLDWIAEGTVHERKRWHNLKYYTWVEQQGKTMADLDAQRDPDWWLAEQAKVAELDRAIRERRTALIAAH
ncbi:MAG: pyridoxal-phosphate dependent enzyme [Cyanobacteria bacterium NC_groundwater_1444_Ag_S-0.65um_54_12]|nr:pyridoxal-phosphate dependent enzyme [Cyanobacteria bacterium NC_groundwater_1444_Ag_S-0.65um_54_12]